MWKEYKLSTARIIHTCRVFTHVVAETVQGEVEVVAEDVTEEEAKGLVKFFNQRNESSPKSGR